MGRHAYLILAHNEFSVLQQLLSLLDDKRNDIYIHFDKKCIVDESSFKTNFGGLYILDSRIDVRWADFSMVEAEYCLFEASFKNGPYDRYHLISGVDLPLKSQDYIHSFFDKHPQNNFIGISEQTLKKDAYRARYYYLFPKEFRDSNSTSLLKRILRFGFVLLQKLVGAPRNRNLIIKKGSQWCSLTNSFVEYLLNHKQYVYRHFNRTFCPDELVVQTLCWNSPFKESIYRATTDGNMRYIHWEKGELIPISKADFSKLITSDKLFARKFDSKASIEFRDYQRKRNEL